MALALRCSTAAAMFFKAALAPASARLLHGSAQLQAPGAAASQADASHLQGLLGIGAAEVETVLRSQPGLLREKPSVVAERIQFLRSGLGISNARLRSLVVEKPALLGDLSIRELRSLAGLN